MRPLGIVTFLVLGWVSAAGLQSGNLEAAGLTRHYEVFVPQSQKDAPLPLVIALHGRAETGAAMAKRTGFNRLAEQEDFVVLYPDAEGGEWNYTAGIPGYPENAPDDVAFLDALVRKISGEVRIDPQRLYVVGFSNGGFMTERLACSTPERYAGFAAVAATGFGGMAETCPDAYPLTFLFVHGTADTNVPWDGLTREVAGRHIPILYSVPQTLEFWANYMGCSADLETTALPTVQANPKTEVRLITFTGCPAGGRLALYALSRGEHRWPRPETSAFDATAAIWAFFRQ